MKVPDGPGRVKREDKHPEIIQVPLKLSLKLLESGSAAEYGSQVQIILDRHNNNHVVILVDIPVMPIKVINKIIFGQHTRNGHNGRYNKYIHSYFEIRFTVSSM